MKKIPGCRWLAMFIFLLTVSLGVSGADADELEEGKNLYAAKCQMCHGANGRGDGPAGAALDPKPADFTNSSFWQNNPEEKISRTVANGKGMMPAFTLKDEEIKAITDYMTHTFKN
jgi:mono/diheme cytochrome c family protein